MKETLTLNCFQLIKTVLDDLYEEIREEHGSLTDYTIKQRLQYLHDKYEDLEGTNAGNIDYNDAVTRFAYVYRYTTAHANILFECINQLEVLRGMFQQEKLTLGCIGGGPGSDILGVLKFLTLYKNMLCSMKRVSFTICDKEKAWGETWHDIDSRIDDFTSASASYHFLPTDVTETTSLKIARKIAKADILTMIYFFSEIYTCREDARDFFECLFAKVKPGTLLFFADNSRQTFYSWVDEVATSNGMEIVEQEDHYLFQTKADEEKEALGYYYKTFGYPKLKAHIAYRVYCKREEDDEDLFF